MINLFFKIFLPEGVRTRIRRELSERSRKSQIKEGFSYDLNRYFRYSIPNKVEGYEHLLAGIVAQTHSIEKGLALRDPNTDFGEKPLGRLSLYLGAYIKRGYPLDRVEIQSARHALEQYRRTAISEGRTRGIVDAMLGKLGPSDDSLEKMGCIETTAKEVRAAGRRDFKSLAYSRHSVRDFSGEPVSLGLIRKAVELAQRSPSSCNRQGGRVYIISDPLKKRKALGLLTGYKGFGEKIDKLLCVAADLRVFEGARERNQGWVEGGMFAMTLLFALHYLGLGACPLNWSVTPARDQRMRNELDIEPSHTVVLFIAVGHLPERFKVAASRRKPVESILRVL